mmetsp:Transcript_19457/g.28844  ORF Transcript_19457/g.28844 Transcript_19457/m.28844 type:complete len:98 (+) Transcript_19457:2338-2631(+)
MVGDVTSFTVMESLGQSNIRNNSSSANVKKRSDRNRENVVCVTFRLSTMKMTRNESENQDNAVHTKRQSQHSIWRSEQKFLLSKFTIPSFRERGSCF